jgi:hypothetical protein
MISERPSDTSLSLDLRIHAIEQRLLERRQRIGREAARFGSKARARMRCSPGMLIGAVGFGVFLDRSTRRNRDRRTWSIVGLLNAAYASGSLALRISSWMSPAPGTQTIADHRPPPS